VSRSNKNTPPAHSEDSIAHFFYCDLYDLTPTAYAFQILDCQDTTETVSWQCFLTDQSKTDTGVCIK
jgi:hypothetical protein